MKKRVVKNTKNNNSVTENTFEKNMRSVASSFERQGRVMDLMLNELQMIRETGKNTERTVNSFVRDVSIHDRRIENIISRVEKLETKIK